MTDAQGPGSHVLYQDFTVTASVPAAILVFDLFIGNRDTNFFAPNSLDFSTPALNQQARVDLLVGGSAPFSVAATDLLMNLYQTRPDDPLVSGYTHISVDITSIINSHLNTPLRLRFAEVDNVLTQQLGVVNVDVVASAVPEPSTFLALGFALLTGACLLRSSQHRRLREFEGDSTARRRVDNELIIVAPKGDPAESLSSAYRDWPASRRRAC